MPTDEATQSIEITAPPDLVLATIRAVDGQVDWVPEILEAQILEEYEDGLPATAWFKATAPVGSDEYTLEYEHLDDGMTWSLVSGKLQTGQVGVYAIEACPSGTRVTFTLRISHHLPLPGFIRQRVVNTLVSNTLGGLKGYLESPQPAADAG